MVSCGSKPYCPMSSEHLSDAQIELRKACQTGDLPALRAALSPQSRTPSLGRALWHHLRGIREDFESLPASLAHVYEDNQCNLPVHYLATGAPVSRSVSSNTLKCTQQYSTSELDNANAACSASSWGACRFQGKANMLATMICRELPLYTG